MNINKEQLRTARLLVVGDAMLDRYWEGAVERISPEAPVPVVKVLREQERVGGAGNVAYNIAALGAQVSFVGVVGDDEAGGRIMHLMKDAGVDVHIGIDPALQTTVKLRVIGRQQQLLRLDFEREPAQEILSLQTTTFERLLPAHDCVIFSDYGKGGLSHISSMIHSARVAKKPVLIDPKGSDYTQYRGATVVTPNLAELRNVVGDWTDEEGLQQRAQNLRTALSLDAVLVTRSEEGMTLFDADGALHVKAQAREVFDVTGAGDTVVATLGALTAVGANLREAVPLANRAGGIVVGKFGTATVTVEELLG